MKRNTKNIAKLMPCLSTGRKNDFESLNLRSNRSRAVSYYNGAYYTV